MKQNRTARHADRQTHGFASLARTLYCPLRRNLRSRRLVIIR
jgi:hypothetical protein